MLLKSSCCSNERKTLWCELLLKSSKQPRISNRLWYPTLCTRVISFQIRACMVADLRQKEICITAQVNLKSLCTTPKILTSGLSSVRLMLSRLDGLLLTWMLTRMSNSWSTVLFRALCILLTLQLCTINTKLCTFQMTGKKDTMVAQQSCQSSFLETVEKS